MMKMMSGGKNLARMMGNMSAMKNRMQN
jgi:hypothetical protein